MSKPIQMPDFVPHDLTDSMNCLSAPKTDISVMFFDHCGASSERYWTMSSVDYYRSVVEFPLISHFSGIRTNIFGTNRPCSEFALGESEHDSSPRCPGIVSKCFEISSTTSEHCLCVGNLIRRYNEITFSLRDLAMLTHNKIYSHPAIRNKKYASFGLARTAFS